MHWRRGTLGGFDRDNALDVIVQGLIELVLEAQGRAAGLRIEAWRSEMIDDFPIFVAEHDVEFCLYLFAVEGVFKSFGDLIAGICCSRGCNSG